MSYIFGYHETTTTCDLSTADSTMSMPRILDLLEDVNYPDIIRHCASTSLTVLEFQVNSPYHYIPNTIELC
jgi:hypothetical protein